MEWTDTTSTFTETPGRTKAKTTKVSNVKKSPARKAKKARNAIEKTSAKKNKRQRHNEVVYDLELLRPPDSVQDITELGYDTTMLQEPSLEIPLEAELPSLEMLSRRLRILTSALQLDAEATNDVMRHGKKFATVNLNRQKYELHVGGGPFRWTIS